MEIFRIHINILEANCLETEDTTVNMVLFDGFCEGDFFQGKIVSGGVDTQIYEKNKPGTLSARYIIRGTDADHNTCSVFIENSGVMENSETITKPRIITDSPSLKWLESARLSGKVLVENEKVTILISTENE